MKCTAVVTAGFLLTSMAFNSNGNKGVACGLGNIQKIKDGEPLVERTFCSRCFTTLVDDTSLPNRNGTLRVVEALPLPPAFQEWRKIMRNLEIDIETYSSVNLQKSGVYRYVEADDFEILLFGYSVDGGEVMLVDLVSGEKIPKKILDALTDENITKWAFNAQFERVCLSRYLGYPFGYYLNPSSWNFNGMSAIWDFPFPYKVCVPFFALKSKS